MSAKEILASLDVEAHDELISQFDVQIAASEDVIALGVLPGPLTSLKLIGVGKQIKAAFKGGPFGSGPSHKFLVGTGAFAGPATSTGIAGKYKLVVKTATVQLFDHSNNLVWSGIGLQGGLTGQYSVNF